MMYRDSHNQRAMDSDEDHEESKEDKKLLEFFLKSQGKEESNEKEPEIDLDYENEY